MGEWQWLYENILKEIRHPSNNLMPYVEHLSIRGFKSIRELQNFELRSLNVLIGANGAGKSNLLDLFKMLSAISQERLQLFTKKEGGPDALLFGGRKQTSKLEVALSFENNRYGYEFSLAPTTNSLIFADEKILTTAGNSVWSEGSIEARMPKISGDSAHMRQLEFATYILPNMQRWRVFHFQDMSDTAYVRNQLEIRNNLQLRPDAGNLGPFLRHLYERHPDHYQRIRNVIRLANPFFKDFVYRKDQNPNDRIGLEWYAEGGDPDMVYSPRQFSDGMLRFICLSTLLNQPENLQPNLILIDEPEIGLHSFALTILAEMIKQAAALKQIIISTQSAEFISHFQPEDIVVVGHEGEESVFKRLDSEHLTHWLEDYTLGDLWKMNVFGGRP